MENIKVLNIITKFKTTSAFGILSAQKYNHDESVVVITNGIQTLEKISHNINLRCATKYINLETIMIILVLLKYISMGVLL